MKIKNKKGQGMFLQIIIAIFVWVGGIMFLPLMEDLLISTRTGLQCAIPATISSGTKLLCLITDTGMIMLIWAIISVCIGVIMGGNK